MFSDTSRKSDHVTLAFLLPQYDWVIYLVVWYIAIYIVWENRNNILNTFQWRIFEFDVLRQ